MSREINPWGGPTTTTEDGRVLPLMRPAPEGGGKDRLYRRLMSVPGRIGTSAERRITRKMRRHHAWAWHMMIDDLREGDLCLDLGANHGEITTRLAATGADVVAVEPDPDTAGALRHAVRGLSNVTVLEAAAGTADGTMTLHRMDGYTGPERRGLSQGATLIADKPGASASNTVEVEVIDIPRWLRESERPVRILKMDVEGAEWDLVEAILADPAASAKAHAIFVETHERYDPARLRPLAARMRAEAERRDRPYVNLYWE